MLSPGVLASYMVSNTPLSMARSTERGATTTSQLARSRCASTASSTTTPDDSASSVRVKVKKSEYKPARTLTYESEDPVLKNSGRPSMCSVASSSSQSEDKTAHCVSTEANGLPSAVKNTAINRESRLERTPNLEPSCPHLSVVHDSLVSPINSDCGIFFPDKTPPTKVTVDRSNSSWTCLLSDLDPSVENESASMMAFALSTPTKDDPRDFLDQFN